jgi:hypothetical protein
MKYTNLDQGSLTGGAMMYEFVFDVRGQEPHKITTFSDIPGAALYRAHTHMQHELEHSPSDYRLQQAARLLRNVQNKVATLVGSVPVEDLPVIAPVVEKRKPRKVSEDPDALLEFMDEVPILSRNDIERQKERESNKFLYAQKLDKEFVE